MTRRGAHIATPSRKGLGPRDNSLREYSGLGRYTKAALFLTLMLLALNVHFVSAEPIVGTYVTVTDNVVPLGQLVVIKIAPHPDRPLTISINDGSNTYRYNGQQLGNTLGFMPQRTGEHTLNVRDQDGNALETVQFLVGELPTPTLAPIEAFNNTNTTNATITTNTTTPPTVPPNTATTETVLPTRTRLVETDKQRYALGETVTITLLTNDTNDFKLNIVFGNDILRLLGNISNVSTFEPKAPGTYRVVVSGIDGAAIDSFVFVIDAPESTQEIPSVETSTIPSPATTPPTVANDNITTQFLQTQQRFKFRNAKNGVEDGTVIITPRSQPNAFAATMLDAQQFNLQEPADVEFIPQNDNGGRVVKHVSVRNFVGQQLNIGIDEFGPNGVEMPIGKTSQTDAWTNLYAIDPTTLNATDVTITVTAAGTELYTCKDWDFANRACLGAWVKVRDVTPGQNYTITLTSADPGFGESVPIPTAGWSKVTTTPADTATVLICSDPSCLQTATNFQPGDTVYIWLNSTQTHISDIQANQLDIYAGADTTPTASYTYVCNNPGGNSNFCSLNFTIPSDWTGWYYLDSDTHRNQAANWFVWHSIITVGTEPVDGDKLMFYADQNYTRPADKFGQDYKVYVLWDAGSGYNASSAYSKAIIKTFHYTTLGGGSGYTVIPNTSINWINKTGPFKFNFTMPSTLSDGNGGWYYFEPNISENATSNVPAGGLVFGRMIQYQNNTVPNILNVSGNSNATSLVSVGLPLEWNFSLNDTDEIDKHTVYICSTNGFSLADCSSYTSNSTCQNGGCSWSSGQVVQVNFTTSGTWTVPASVSSIKVEVIGAGGAGGGRTANGYAGGGGGGASATSIFTVTPGANYNIGVGAGGIGGTGNGPAGGPSNFTNSTNSSIVVAAGGSGGLSAGAGGGSGNATGSVGQSIRSGGTGGTAVSPPSGGGGGGAGNNTAGTNAVGGTAGTGGTVYGGNGGAGVAVGSAGNPGNNYGGGGSGARRNGAPNRAGGDGAGGIVIITYVPYICTGTPTNSCTGTTFCANSTWDLARNLTCSVTANPTMNTNTTGYAFVCDSWSCSPGVQINFSVYNDSEAPTVQLATPINPSTLNNFTITFNYIPSDDYGFANCSLYLNISGWNPVITEYAPVNGTNNYLDYTVPGDGGYAWNVKCSDYAGNAAFASLNYTLTVQGPPIIYLKTPLNNSFTNTLDVNLTYNTSYSAPMDTCELLINGTQLATDTPITVGTVKNFTYSFTQDGVYDWNVQCNASDGTLSIGDGVYNYSVPRILTIDSTPPTATLLDPTPGEIVNVSTVDLVYLPDDNFGLANCTVYVDGAPISTNPAPQANANNSVGYILENGIHNWYVSCTDLATNTYLTDTQSFNVTANTSSGFIFYETNNKPGNVTTITQTAKINLSTQTDGSENAVQRAISGNSPGVYVNAFGAAFQSNGILINPNTLVNFSGYFGSQTASSGYITWRLYKSDGITDTSICDFGNDFTGGRLITAAAKTRYIGSCNTRASNYVRILGNETIRLYVDIYNNDNRRRTFTHYIDNTSSYVSFNFTRLGFLSSNISSPSIGLTVGVGEATNVTCKYNCTGGSCINTQIYLQRNSSTGWINVTGADSPLTLNASTPNPRNLSLVSYPGWTTSFLLNATQIGNETLRCWATSNYSNITTTGNVTITIAATSAPTIQLLSPGNATYVGSSNINFTYIPSSNKNITNCSIYINNVLNQTNISITKDVSNQFSINGFAEGNYWWNVSCNDSAGKNGRSKTYLFYSDKTPPNVTLNAPLNNMNFTTNRIVFNWTAIDGVDPTMTCSLYIDNNLNGVVATQNGTPANITISSLSVGVHQWNVSCTDDAGNTNVSPIYRFNITNLGPNVTAIGPPNATWTNNITIVFSYNVSELDQPLYNYSRNFSAIATYRSTTLAGVNLPKVRNWTGTQWQAETQLSTAGSAVQWVKMASSPYSGRRYEKIAVTLSADGLMDAYIWNGTVWSVTNNIGDTGSGAAAGMDVAYEKQSGRAILAYALNSGSNAQDFAYTIWNGTAWSAQTIVNDPLAGGNIQIGFLRMASNPNSSSNDIMMTYIDTTNGAARAWRWDGTNWLNETTVTAALSTTTEEDIAVAYGRQSYHAVAVAGTGSTIAFSHWNGTAWNTTGTYDVNTAAAGTTNWLTLKSDPASNNLMLTDVDAGNDLSTALWNGANWTGATTHDQTIDTNAARPADFDWESTNGRGLLVWGTAAGSLNYRTYTGAWGVANAVSTADGNTHTWVTLRNVPDPRPDIKILGAFEAAGSNALGSLIWYGVGVPTVVSNTFTASQGVSTFQSHDLSVDLFPPAAITSPFYRLSNCSLYIDNTFNQSNATPVRLEEVNNFTGTNIAEGIHTWYVNCTDTDLLWNKSATYTLRIDRTPPYVNLTQPSNASNLTVSNIIFAFNATDELSSSMTCNLTLDGVVNATGIAANNRSNTTKTITGVPDGTHLWNVTCTDLAGNSNTSVTYQFTNGAPPNVTLLYPANNGYNSSEPLGLFYNVTKSGNIANCSLFFDNAFNSTNASVILNGGKNNFTLSNVPEGLHNWWVTCIDVGSLVGNSSKYNVTVDRTPPNVTLNAPNNSIAIRASVVVVNWTAYDNIDQSLSCFVTRKGPDTPGSNSAVTPSPNGTPTTLTYSGLPDGQHYWNVTCTDDAALKNWSVTWTFNVSSLPSVTLVSPAPNYQNNTGNLTLTYVPFQSGGIANCTLIINQTQNWTNTSISNNVNNYFYLWDLPDGDYNWSVNCTDNSEGTQNSSTRKFTIDKIPPFVNLTAPQNATTQTNNTVKFNYTPTDDRSSTLACSLAINGTYYSPNQTVNNNASQVTSVLLHGGNQTYSWNVTCRDNAINYNTSETWFFNLIAPPSVTLLTPINNSPVLENMTLTYRPYDPFGLASCTVYFDGAANWTNTSISNNTNNTFYLYEVTPGRHNWTVNCTDNDGDSFAPEPFYFSNDNTPPFITLIAPPNPTDFFISNVTFNWTAYDDYATNMSCSVYIDSINRGTNITLNNSNASSYVTNIRDGTRLWNVTCIDQVGNTNTSDTWTFTVNQTPSVGISSPPDATLTNNGTVIFKYTPYDNDGFANCTLFINGAANQTNQSIVLNNALNNITINLTTGKYNWSVRCVDNGTLANENSSGNRSITINLLAPNVSLNGPPDGTLSNVSWLVFNWTANETFGNNLTCNVSVNNTVRAPNVISPSGVPTTTQVVNLNDSYQTWNVTCLDSAGNRNYSQTWNFTIAEPPNVSLGLPSNGLRTNNLTINFTFIPNDNSKVITSCSLIINGVYNASVNSPSAGSTANITVPGFVNGTYGWLINCTDLAGNTVNSTNRTLSIDTYPPIIGLTYPGNMSSVGTNVTFNWTANDSGTVVTCNLTLDGVVNISNIPGVSGTPFAPPVPNIPQGTHQWNVTCWDDLLQANTSQTYNFTVQPAELVLNDSSRIAFNNTNPNLNDTINITANVTNLGGVPSTFNVSFWDGLPENGINIGNATITVTPNASYVASVKWNITEGYHTIYAIADYDNIIFEIDKTNNNASLNISVLRVLFNTPPNATITKNVTQEINFTVLNYTGGNFTYTIFVDGAKNGQNGTVTDNISTTINLNTLSEGVHRVIVQANDSNRFKNSSPVAIIVDLTPPAGAFLTLNNTFFQYSPLNVTFLTNDSFSANIDYVIYLNGVANTSGTTPNASTVNATLAGLPNGIYNLTLQVVDSVGNIANRSNITIFVDNVAPNITLNSPADGANFSTRSVTLNYTPADNLDPVLQCNVTLDSTVLASFVSVNSSASATSTANNLFEGTHLWNVTCWDGNNAVNQVNNLNISATQSFNVYIPPLLTLITPLNNTYSNNATQVFVYNVSDNTGITNCSLYLNGVLNTTNITAEIILNGTNNFTVNGLNNTVLWQVVCIDNSTGKALNASENRTLVVDLVAPFPSINTPPNTWFNTGNPNINITIFDNIETTVNWTFFVDGVANTAGTVPNGSATMVGLSGVTNGSHTILVMGYDRAGNYRNSSSITINIDTVQPNVTLLSPANNTNVSFTSVELNFTANDNLAAVLACNLTLDNVVVQQFNLTNATNASFQTGSLNSGYHYWNVSCYDNASNRGLSETWRFFVNLPDLVITADNITVSNNTPIENQTISVNATIFNIGLLNITRNFTVQLYRGDPLFGGVQMGTNQTVQGLGIGANITLTFNYTTIIGLNQIYIAVDTPLATNGSVNESNETNNKANYDITVGLYEVFTGGQDGTLKISDNNIIAAFTWNQTNTTGSNVFVADTDSSINFVNLQAIGINRTNGTGVGNSDFDDIDARLNTTNLNDSINRTWVSGGAPLGMMNITAFKRQILNIPIVNSTNTSSFVTGILWDMTGNLPAYNGTQPIVFMTVMNQSQTGLYGTYDFEIKVPAKLRDYVLGGGTITFYTELR